MLKITATSLRFNPLDDPADLLDLPPKRTGEHCALRLCEGFKTLRQLPMKGAPARFRNCWPTHMVEWEDLFAQAEGDALQATQRAQNRVKIQPSALASRSDQM